MPDLAELFEDPAVAGWVLGALVRDWASQRGNGLALPPRAVEMAVALQTAAGGDFPVERFASETSHTNISAMGFADMVSVAAAALAGEVSEPYDRRLAGKGRIRAKRDGRDWRIDTDSLLRVLRRTA